MSQPLTPVIPVISLKLLNLNLTGVCGRLHKFIWLFASEDGCDICLQLWVLLKPPIVFPSITTFTPSETAAAGMGLKVRLVAGLSLPDWPAGLGGTTRDLNCFVMGC